MNVNKKFKNKYRIESIRLKNYDYSANGAYFITICTKNRKKYFGKIINGKFYGNIRSKICLSCWYDVCNHYNNCMLDKFVIMPNHVHMIIFIENKFYDNNIGGGTPFVETGFKPVSTVNSLIKHHSISEIVRGFKTFTSRQINIIDHTPGRKFWQERFYEHVIRHEHALNNIRRYIINNPIRWERDRNNIITP